MNLIQQNLNKQEGTFYEILTEEGLFNQQKFEELIIYLSDLNNSNLEEIERLRYSRSIWQLGFRIASSIAYSLHSRDVFEIKNISVDNQVEIQNFLDYMCTGFSNGSKINIEYIMNELNSA